MIRNRLTNLMNRLTQGTVLSALMEPAWRALEGVRGAERASPVLDMQQFITLGVLRHLQGAETLREQVQQLLHLDLGTQGVAPLARSTWSDALASGRRLQALRGVTAGLMAQAALVLPDRLRAIPGLGARAVILVDGTYPEPSAHFRHCPPRAGGDHNPKGHGVLAFFDLRRGVPGDALTEIHNRHEQALLRDYDQQPNALTQRRGALFVADRAFIDAAFWDAKKAKLGITLITRMKSNLRIDSTEAQAIAPDPLNAGVERDLIIRLSSSAKPWRLITYRPRRGRPVEFLTNDFSLAPGVIAFLYARRWEIEKCFDTWKNDFAQAKAWGKSVNAIDAQLCLAIITSVLVALLLHNTLGEDGSRDIKSLRRQAKRAAKATHLPDGTDRPRWSAAVFRYTSKVSRQVLRFFKHAFLEPASPALLQGQLRRLLMDYL
jgi:hypothetical protein